jgi:hypothetical protein
MKNVFETDSDTGISEGKFFERALLGDTFYEETLEKSHELEKLLKTYEKISVRNGFVENTHRQPWKCPWDPQRPFPASLRLTLIKNLELLGIKDLKNEDVKYYTAVGDAPLDDYSGTDFYFVVTFMLKGKRVKRLITGDVSFKDKGDEDIRADIFRRFPDTMQMDDNDWKKSIALMTYEMANKLVSPQPLKMEMPGAMERSVHKIPWKILKEQK